MKLKGDNMEWKKSSENDFQKAVGRKYTYAFKDKKLAFIRRSDKAIDNVLYIAFDVKDFKTAKKIAELFEL